MEKEILKKEIRKNRKQQEQSANRKPFRENGRTIQRQEKGTGKPEHGKNVKMIYMMYRLLLGIVIGKKFLQMKFTLLGQLQLILLTLNPMTFYPLLYKERVAQ